MERSVTDGINCQWSELAPSEARLPPLEHVPLRPTLSPQVAKLAPALALPVLDQRPKRLVRPVRAGKPRPLLLVAAQPLEVGRVAAQRGRQFRLLLVWQEERKELPCLVQPTRALPLSPPTRSSLEGAPPQLWTPRCKALLLWQPRFARPPCLLTRVQHAQPVNQLALVVPARLEDLPRLLVQKLHAHKHRRVELPMRDHLTRQPTLQLQRCPLELLSPGVHPPLRLLEKLRQQKV